MPGPPRRSRHQVLFGRLIEIEALPELPRDAAAELQVPRDAELLLELLELLEVLQR